MDRPSRVRKLRTGKTCPRLRCPWWSAGRRRPPTALGGARLARRAPDPLVRRALRHWARRLPALHPLVSRGEGKKGRAGPAARKSEVAGRRSAPGACPATLPAIARAASKAGARRGAKQFRSKLTLRVYFAITTEGSERAKRTHFGLADTAQIHVLIGFAAKVALSAFHEILRI